MGLSGRRRASFGGLEGLNEGVIWHSGGNMTPRWLPGPQKDLFGLIWGVISRSIWPCLTCKHEIIMLVVSVSAHFVNATVVKPFLLQCYSLKVE